MTFECPDCGKELSTKRGRDSHRSQVHDWSRMVNVDCDWCGDSFEKKRSHVNGKHSHKRTFCSMDCRSSWQETQTGENHPRWEGGKTTYRCETCGEKYQGWPKDNRKYCSRDCQVFAEGKDHHSWKPDSKSWPSYGSGWHKQRKKARERDRCCQVCGLPSWAYRCLHGRAMDVHHIIPFDRFDDPQEANRLSNLMTLCASCHNIVERSA